ncbi:phosphomannomutase CpsG, partial [Klebsiella pneumoniae]|nr:phosphomannomutase CpsG [Klebsiella pneumoniae]MDE4770063.1 phosphomannomutase CpsG [Klebsiella pneumoniae]
IARIRERYEPDAVNVDTTDGISIEYPEWRFNLRSSNTEPVVRLNVESKSNIELMKMRTAELLDYLN